MLFVKLENTTGKLLILALVLVILSGCTTTSKALDEGTVQWIAQDAKLCENVRYGCDDGIKFSNESGCGCIIEENHTHDEMIDRVCIYTKPNTTYVSKDYEQCQLIKFSCEENEYGFSNICGCGCSIRN